MRSACAVLGVLLLLCGAVLCSGPTKVLNTSNCPATGPWSCDQRRYWRDRVVEMFAHAYGSYKKYAFPKDELKPMTCSGMENKMLKGQALTLVDSLDMLVLMGKKEEFHWAAKWIEDHLLFNHMDQNVSVFETNIRILGGLVSGHMLATVSPDLSEVYNGGLLNVAETLGNALLPAFNTPTHLPYGTINLKHGVPPKETAEVCTACAGTFLLEFSALSRLTGKPKFEAAAKRAATALWSRRTKLGLLGSHINCQTGGWTLADSGIGSGADSYFEYLFKYHIISNDAASLSMFSDLYKAVMKHNFKSPWYADVQCHSGKPIRNTFSSLSAFWPGLQASLGELGPASCTLEAMAEVWTNMGFLPEGYDWDKRSVVTGQAGYPLRPELAESLVYLWEATQEQQWLDVGKSMVTSVNTELRLRCGFHTLVDVEQRKGEDRMDSFFVAEWLKYLFLLFDPDSTLDTLTRGHPVVFTTEAHILPLTPALTQPFRIRGSELIGACPRLNYLQRLLGPNFVPEPARPHLQLVGPAGIEVRAFNVGDIVSHRVFGYRAVVVEVDPVCEMELDWQKRVMASREGAQIATGQYFYHLLPDAKDRPSSGTTYVAHEMLSASVSRAVVEHPLVHHIFNSNKRLKRDLKW